MDEARYDRLVASAFQRLLDALDQVDPDVLDVESTGDMLTITSASGEACVVNTQRAIRQLWVAGGGQGLHFAYDEQGKVWRDDRGTGIDLFDFVAQVVREMSAVRPP